MSRDSVEDGLRDVEGARGQTPRPPYLTPFPIIQGNRVLLGIGLGMIDYLIKVDGTAAVARPRPLGRLHGPGLP